MLFSFRTAQCERMTLSAVSPTPLHASAMPSPATGGRFAQLTVNQRYPARTVTLVPNAGKALFSSFDESSGGKIGRAEYTAERLDAVPQQLPEQSVAPASSSGAPRMSGEAAGNRSTPEERALVLLEVKEFLSNELPSMWVTGVVTANRYATDVTFIDPILEYTGREAYIWNVEALRAAFDVTFTLLGIESKEPSEIITRFSMLLRAKFLPWKPQVTITGRAFYSVDTAGGVIMSQREEWDALTNNTFLSFEGLAYVLRSLGKVQLTPTLDSPSYTVLRATSDYEIRQYNEFLVAEVDMPAGSGPAGGDGFNELAGYIFGSNTRRTKMEMTMPVFSTAGQSNGSTGRMSFPMESQYSTNMDALPVPNDSRVERRLQKSAVVAAFIFPGLPFDWEVLAAERQLRGFLLLDQLEPCEGYRLARYNEPFVPPPLRRNEILIECEGYSP